MNELYVVIKINQNTENEIIYQDLSRDEAKDICSDDNTSGPDWFYGFDKQDNWI